MRTRFNEVNDRATIAKLCYHLIAVVPFKDLVKFYDVGVVHLLQQLQLSKYLIPLALYQMFLLDDLDCSQLLGFQANGSVDTTIGTFPHDFLKLIVLFDVLLPQMNKLLLTYFDLTETFHILLSHHILFQSSFKLSKVWNVNTATWNFLFLLMTRLVSTLRLHHFY